MPGQRDWHISLALWPPPGGVVEREEGAVAGLHADQASAAEGGRSVIGDDRLALGHDLLLRLLLARGAEERFEEAAGLIGGAGLLDRDLKLPAAGVDLALVEGLRGEAGIAALELADLLGDRAAFGRAPARRGSREGRARSRCCGNSRRDG